MFLDKVEITIKAGNGGNGSVSFFRDKLTMHGGPDGGDGGKGGDVIFVGSTRVDNLIEFRFTKKFKAADGENGGQRNRFGAGGNDLEIPVPLGTKIYKIASGSSVVQRTNEKSELVADITAEGQKYRALRGGAGGRGNARFATSKKQTPNFSQDGVKTQEYKVLLELSSIADVGLVGFPNVGKSTLLSVISRANPKIANYHFTTLHPNLGVVSVFDKSFIVADIPGLIEGASSGAGLGHEFLRHISRTRILVHVVDISGTEGRDPVADFHTINCELAAFNAELSKKPQIVVLNKSDIDNSRVSSFKKVVKGYKILEISGATQVGVQELLKTIAVELEKLPKVLPSEPMTELEVRTDKNAFVVSNSGSNYYVKGPFIDNLIRGVVLSDTESNSYFQRRLVESGIIEALKNQGMKDGDTVHIADIEFEYID